MDNETIYYLAINAIVSASLIILGFIFLMIKEHLVYKKRKKEILEYNLKIEKLIKENN